MKVDAASPWTSYLTVNGEEKTFDTPRCAFSAWRKAGAAAGHARFREYYSQEVRDVDTLGFVRGSDVGGPMGPDLVPVSLGDAARFARDHNGAPAERAPELLKGEAP